MAATLLTLADLGQVRRLELTTMRTSWRERVRLGDLPPPVPGKGHPRWNPEEVARFFSSDRPQIETGKKTRVQKRNEQARASIARAMLANG